MCNALLHLPKYLTNLYQQTYLRIFAIPVSEIAGQIFDKHLLHPNDKHMPIDTYFSLKRVHTLYVALSL